jgi:hypothetical protein
MPGSQLIPQGVRDFLDRYIRSVEDLYLLVAMAQTRDRWWDAASAAQELGVGRSAAAGVLEHLARHSLLDIRVTDDVRYQFRPVTPEIREAVMTCAAAYNADPVPIVRALTAARQRNLQAFADAFRIRRE